MRARSWRRNGFERKRTPGSSHASLAEVDIAGARLTGAEIYGAGVWGLKGEPADQSGLVLQADWEAPPITVDDLDTARFLFLLLDNPKIADVIETASSRTVLLIPQELSHIVPYPPSVPVVPLLGEGERAYAMFEHFARTPGCCRP